SKDATGLLQFYAACLGRAARIVRQTTSGVAGMSICAMPSSASASTIALISAGGEPIAPASPAPFTPKGLVRHGTTLYENSSGGGASPRPRPRPPPAPPHP